jgi:xanthine dehydrogenase large subunit
MLAISVREAIRDAIAAFGAGGPISLESPATAERVFFAVQRARAERESRETPVSAGAGAPLVMSKEIPDTQ